MNAAENPFGGGISEIYPRPKGQSTVEYVLVIAIIVLVVLIAGPWVSAAIRNQFNLVTGASRVGHRRARTSTSPRTLPDPTRVPRSRSTQPMTIASCSTSAAVCPRRETCSTTAG